MPDAPAAGAPAQGQTVLVALAWLYVGIPLVWGVAQTVIKSAALFQ